MVGKIRYSRRSIPVTFMTIEDSCRKNHLAIYAGSHMIGDVSGDNIDVPLLDACDLLSEATLRKKGLNPLEIETEDKMIKSQIEALRTKSNNEPDRELRQRYRKEADDLKEKYRQTQKKVSINVGFEMAKCIKEYMALFGVNVSEPFYVYNKHTMERNKNWMTKPFS